MIPVPRTSSRRMRSVFPFLLWLPKVNGGSLRADALAGVTGALVVLPQGVAFATIAGMPPEYGLYAGMVPAVIAALFGSSWHLVSGPTTAASLVLFSSLSVFAEPGSAKYVELALTLTLMVGLLELALALFKLGTLVNFVSHSVVIGFTAGAGVLIASNQVKNFFGLDVPQGAHFYEVIMHLLTHFKEIEIPVAMIGALTVASGLAARKLAPRAPYMIVAIVVGSLGAASLNWGGTGVPTIGALPAQLPPLSLPSFDLDVWRALAPTASAVTLFALTEALSISRALAVRSGQHIDANQEFLGQGLSNVIGGFFSSYVATGSFNRSGLNFEAGARTPLAAILSGLLLMGIVLLVAPFARYMPNAAMAGVLFIVAWGLIDRHHIGQIIRTSRSETAVLVVTFVSTLFLELEYAIFVGVLLSLLVYLNHTSHPRIVARVPDPFSPGRKFTSLGADLPECHQLRFIRIDGSLFFGAVSTFKETLRDYEEAEPDRKHLAIVMSGVNFVDIAGAEALAEAARHFREKGGALHLIHAKARVLDLLGRGGYLDEIGRQNLFQSKTEAIRSIYRKLDYARCKSCDRRVFVECLRMGKQEPQIEEESEPLGASAGALSPSSGPIAIRAFPGEAESSRQNEMLQFKGLSKS